MSTFRPAYQADQELPASEAHHRDLKPLIRELAALGVQIEEVGPARQSLEEIFLALAERPS